ncbi:hypothetical protein H6P81_009597 [Aristolochia fimbriata]|uniref:Uncharacterized protein n=1 Tax=Aristolochia fimbriata TaxID=158543 RepID=A0AAV7ELD4_ARIFI|nr:hypothetical protein H6P81_009597 [Aristolochia fimbriata]
MKLHIVFRSDTQIQNLMGEATLTKDGQKLTPYCFDDNCNQKTALACIDTAPFNKGAGARKIAIQVHNPYKTYARTSAKTSHYVYIRPAEKKARLKFFYITVPPPPHTILVSKHGISRSDVSTNFTHHSQPPILHKQQVVRCFKRSTASGVTTNFHRI